MTTCWAIVVVSRLWENF